MRFLNKVLAKGEPKIPKSIVDYVRGFAGLPSKAAADVKRYHAWLQSVLQDETYTVYRAFALDGDITEGDNIFADDPMSFSEDKEFALRLAKERHEDQPYYYSYAIKMKVPKDRIYFHWEHAGELGTEHSREKEIMVLADHLPYKIIKRIKPVE